MQAPGAEMAHGSGDGTNLGIGLVSGRQRIKQYICYLAGGCFDSVCLTEADTFGTHPQYRLGRNCGHPAVFLVKAMSHACRRAQVGFCSAGLAVCDLHPVPRRLYDGRSQCQSGRTGDGQVEAGAAAALSDDQRFVDAGA